MINYKKALLLLICTLSFSFLVNISPANCQAVCNGGGCTNEQDNAFLDAAGFNRSDTVGSIVKTVIQVFLSLLGLIFIILMLYAGFLWMTANGEEDKVKKAKDIITAAVIGLVIVVAAYSITFFVFNALRGASGGGGTVNITSS